MLIQFTRGLASKYVARTHHSHTTNETALNDATPNTQKRPVNSLQAALNDFAYVSGQRTTYNQTLINAQRGLTHTHRHALPFFTTHAHATV